jgi:UDP-N-acetylglucosamine 4-epimerase
MSNIDTLRERLRTEPRRWLLTGAAGFIGSNLLQELLELGQEVVGLDDLSTGKESNLEEVRDRVGAERWSRFTFVRGDVAAAGVCREALRGVSVVLHQAALGSVPRSIANPLSFNASNVTGTLTLLEEARRAGLRRFVYASSSSVYGDDPDLPKREEKIGRPLSPYAVTKVTNELYALTYGLLHGLETVGLRYFNVFGPRQDPEGAYAAVIPRWIAAMIRGNPVTINGSGETSRDFCYIGNVVQANLLAATVDDPKALNEVYNVATGHRATLLQLFELLRARLAARHPRLEALQPVHGPFRPGDVLHSLADVDKARRLLGYAPTHSLEQGLDESLAWYEEHVDEVARPAQRTGSVPPSR